MILDEVIELIRREVVPWAPAHAARIAEAAARELTAAGRLLPEPLETREEWGVDWHAEGEGIVLSERHFGWRAKAEKRGQERIGEYGITRYTLHRREHRIFADHSSWSGPWVPVDPPADPSPAPIPQARRAMIPKPHPPENCGPLVLPLPPGVACPTCGTVPPVPVDPKDGAS